ncbi:hypothetical protein EVAR_85266_1 [Eumeta japonica]|uniref:Uncharacterized protein n=1 Tax=Eumeta variegata TaxID=151549 RepID=A0A4C1V7U1_EUMVA|nr:hypothetical protein EVAR_85266_1 [Eumeta japonica]
MVTLGIYEIRLAKPWKTTSCRKLKCYQAWVDCIEAAESNANLLKKRHNSASTIYKKACLTTSTRQKRPSDGFGVAPGRKG